MLRNTTINQSCCSQTNQAKRHPNTSVYYCDHEENSQNLVHLSHVNQEAQDCNSSAVFRRLSTPSTGGKLGGPQTWKRKKHEKKTEKISKKKPARALGYRVQIVCKMFWMPTLRDRGCVVAQCVVHERSLIHDPHREFFCFGAIACKPCTHNEPFKAFCVDPFKKPS